MKKILIWDNFELKNVGGPSGYLYNLHEHLLKHPCEQIVFLSDLMKEHEGGVELSITERSGSNAKGKDAEFYSKIKEKIHKLKRELRKPYDFCWKQYRDQINWIPSDIDLNVFDYIHFHWAIQIGSFKYRYPFYKGKIILTPHCPCLYVDEFLSQRSSWFKLFRPVALYNECRAYKQTDYIMFPCKSAREPYEKDKKVKSIFDSKEDHIFYVPTAILDSSINISNAQKLINLGIPNDAFVIGYFGRHNRIKGYDILKKVGEALLDIIPNLYILCAGVGDIAPLEHNRWIELGFINNTKELLPQCDLYILPNRETYFDIITLEVLRAGVNIIMSDTGGNKYFKEIPHEKTIGISYFNIKDIDSLIDIVKTKIKEKNEDPECFSNRKRKNRELFENWFSLGMYTKRYIESINRI